MKVDELQIGKTYHPTGMAFGPNERRTVVFKGSSLTVATNEHGNEMVIRHNTPNDSVDYIEVKKFFQVAGEYMYGDSSFRYKIIEVNNDRRLAAASVHDIDGRITRYCGFSSTQFDAMSKVN